MQPAASIILIGCGKMGSALLSGGLNADTNAQFTIIEPHEVSLPVTHHKTIEQATEAINAATMVILAVKPQIMNDIAKQLSPHLNENTTILSIAAGQSLSKFATLFGEKQPVIRAMPNTPAAIGKSATVAVQNNHVDDAAKTLASKLISSAGTLEWIDNENLMDSVTALSGSGPAYIFHLIETLATSGEAQGLPADLAMKLARQTVIGAAALAEHNSKTPASTLRENVTSPGGTTAAALEILMNGEMQEIYNRALAAATSRGKELNTKP